MAQNLKPNHSDNRGGNKPITSTKKMFTWRVYPSKHKELKAYAIELNKQVEEESNKRYTIHMHGEDSKGHSIFTDLGFNLPENYAEAICRLKNIDAEATNSDYGYSIYPIN